MSDYPGWVYFIREERTGDPTQDLIKIGWSSNVTNRVFSLRPYVNGPLTVLVCFPGSTADEKMLHERFSASRVKGEWFVPCPEILEAIATGHIATLPPGEFSSPGVLPRHLNLYLPKEDGAAILLAAKHAALDAGMSVNSWWFWLARKELGLPQPPEPRRGRRKKAAA
jgi:T5orf172 domain